MSKAVYFYIGISAVIIVILIFLLRKNNDQTCDNYQDVSNFSACACSGMGRKQQGTSQQSYEKGNTELQNFKKKQPASTNFNTY